jgi:hypothetical protein
MFDNPDCQKSSMSEAQNTPAFRKNTLQTYNPADERLFFALWD